MIVIFDFDNTLVRLNVDWDSVRSELKEIAKSENIVHDPDMRIIPLTNFLAPWLKPKIDLLFENKEASAVKNNDYVVFKKMVELARRLHSEGHILAIVSGNCNSTLEAVLRQVSIDDCFSIIIGRDMVRLTKPDPEGILIVMERLGANAIYIGDSDVDVIASEKAGIPHFRVSDPENDPEKIIRLIHNHSQASRKD